MTDSLHPSGDGTEPRKVRLAYLVSHPIQYHAPLLRRIALEPDIDLTVLFGSNFSVRGYKDRGFGVEVAWATPLLEGYRSDVPAGITRYGRGSPITPDQPRPSFVACNRVTAALRSMPCGVHGYASINSLQAILAANPR